MQIATMAGGFLAAAYCMHKAFDKLAARKEYQFLDPDFVVYGCCRSHLRAIPLLELGMVDGGRFGVWCAALPIALLTAFTK